jgi:hypothetical protein
MQAESAEVVSFTQDSFAFDGIVIFEDVRGSGAPCSVHLDPYSSICFDVAHLTGLVSVRFDQPERVVDEAVADGCNACLARAPPDRLQKCVARRWDAQTKRELVERVDYRFLERGSRPGRGRGALSSPRAFRICGAWVASHRRVRSARGLPPPNQYSPNASWPAVTARRTME